MADIDFAVVVAVVADAGARISSSFSTIFPSSFFATSSTVVVALTTSNGVSTTSTFVSTFLSFDFINKSTFSSLFFFSISLCFCRNCLSIVSKLFTNENATTEPAIVINGSEIAVEIAAVAAVTAAVADMISFLFGTASNCRLTNSARSAARFDISIALSLDRKTTSLAVVLPPWTLFRPFPV